MRGNPLMASLIVGLRKIANPPDLDLLEFALRGNVRLVRAHGRRLTARDVRRIQAVLRALATAIRQSDVATIQRIAAALRTRPSRIRTR